MCGFARTRGRCSVRRARPHPPAHYPSRPAPRARADAARPAAPSGSGALAPSRQQPKSLPGLLLFSPVKLPGIRPAVAAATAPAPAQAPASAAALRPDALSTGLKAQPVLLTAAGDRAELQPVHNVRLVAGRDVDARSCRDYLTGGASGAPASPDEPFLVMWPADGRTKTFTAAPLAALRDVRRGTAGAAIFRYMQEHRLGADFSGRCLALVFSSAAAGGGGGAERQLELVLDSCADMGSAYEQLVSVREGLERRRLLAAAVSMPPPPPPPPPRRTAVAPKLVPVAFPFAGSVVVAPGQSEAPAATPRWASGAAAAQRARLEPAAASVALAPTPSASLARAPLPASAAPGRSTASRLAEEEYDDDDDDEEAEEEDEDGMPRAPVPPTPGGAIRGVSLLPARPMPGGPAVTVPAADGGGPVLTSPMHARVPRGRRTAHATTPGRVARLTAAAAPTPTMAEITRAPVAPPASAAELLGVDADADATMADAGATERRVTFASPRLDLSRLATGARARAAGSSIDELLDGHVTDEDGDDDDEDDDDGAPLDTERSAVSTASRLTGTSRSSSATPAGRSARSVRTPHAATARKTPHASGTEQRRLFATSSAYGSLMAVSAALPEDAEWSDKDRSLYWHGMIWDVVANDQVEQFSLELDDGESRARGGLAGWDPAEVHAR